MRRLATKVSLAFFPPGSQYSEQLYPGGRAVRFSFQLALTNTGDRPLRFDPTRQAITMGLPFSSPTSSLSREYSQLNPAGTNPPLPAPEQPLAQAIAPHQTVLAWASFAVTPPGAMGRGADLNFLTPGESMMTSVSPDTNGDIRRWKWDNEQGRRALGVPTFKIPGTGPGSFKGVTGAGQLSDGPLLPARGHV
jgi:hypothetical protein